MMTYGTIRLRAPCRRWTLLVWAIACVVFTSPTAHGQTRELRWNAAADVGVTGVGGALYLTSVLLHADLAPTRCRWCSANDVDLRARDLLVWTGRAEAIELSDVGLALAPVAGLGIDALVGAHDRASRGIGVDALVIAEATVLALDVNEIGKLLVARERPDVRARRLQYGTPRARTPDDFLSFYSGHTTSTFAIAAATGTVATMRGYRWAPIPWIAGGALAAGTGYFRIAADRHWLTDVLVGMATGVAIGIAVPLLFHSPTSE